MTSQQHEIPERETLSVEFKSDLKRLRDSELIDTVVALCNTDGGIIYLGVEDNGTPTGVHREHGDTDDMREPLGEPPLLAPLV